MSRKHTYKRFLKDLKHTEAFLKTYFIDFSNVFWHKHLPGKPMGWTILKALMLRWKFVLLSLCILACRHVCVWEQITAFGVSLCFPHCLRQDQLLFAAVHTRLADHDLLGVLLSLPLISLGLLRLQMWASCVTLCGFWGSERRFPTFVLVKRYLRPSCLCVCFNVCLYDTV